MSDAVVFTTPTDTEVQWTRAFDAPRALVFEALTKPEFIKQWMIGSEGATMPVCEIDFKPGGTFRYVWRGPDSKEGELRGSFKEIVAPERIVHTEQFHAAWTGPDTTVTSVFEETGGQTTLTVTQQFPSQEVRDMMLKSGMKEGIIASYDALAKVIANAD